MMKNIFRDSYIFIFTPSCRIRQTPFAAPHATIDVQKNKSSGEKIKISASAEILIFVPSSKSEPLNLFPQGLFEKSVVSMDFCIHDYFFSP